MTQEEAVGLNYVVGRMAERVDRYIRERLGLRLPYLPPDVTFLPPREMELAEDMRRLHTEFADCFRIVIGREANRI